MTPPEPTQAPPRTAIEGRASAAGARARKLALSGLFVATIAVLVVAAVHYSKPIATPARRADNPAAAATPPGAPLAQFQPEVESQNFQVAEASGRVEVQRNNSWELVKAGDVLTKDDVIRTGVGRALLKLTGETEIEIRDRVELRLDSISRAGASVDLRRGKVTAHVAQGGHSIAITAANTRTANVGDQRARFVVTADGRGGVAVATTEGAAAFEAGGRTVTVRAGTESYAEPGGPPVDPETIAEDVLLTVAWPVGERHEERLSIPGNAKPGSLIRVNGSSTPVDRTGHFVASISMRDGPNQIDVEAEDAVGRLKREHREIKKMTTREPELVPVTKELWDQ